MLSVTAILLLSLGMVWGGAMREHVAVETARNNELLEENMLNRDVLPTDRLNANEAQELSRVHKMDSRFLHSSNNQKGAGVERSKMKTDDEFAGKKVTREEDSLTKEMKKRINYESGTKEGKEWSEMVKEDDTLASKMSRRITAENARKEGMETMDRSRLMKETGMAHYNRRRLANIDSEDIPETGSEKFQTLSLQELLEPLIKASSNCVVNKTQLKFILYTKNNEGNHYKLYLDNNEKLVGLKQSLFNKDKKTKIIIPGYLQTISFDTEYGLSYQALKDIVNTYLTEQDVNVIVVDYGKYWNCEFLNVTKYVVPDVGKYTARMLKSLIDDAQVSISDLHVIGYGIGAHIASYVALNLGSIKLPRITGLDPTGPNFEGNGVNVRSLSSKDAEFVDVIHTNAGLFGVSSAIGHADFYVNGGNGQVGCSLNNRDFCSHERSLKYFNESISSKTGYYGVPCTSFADFKLGKCDNDKQELMGENVSKSARGKYYVKTNNQYPFAFGKIVKLA